MHTYTVPTSYLSLHLLMDLRPLFIYLTIDYCLVVVWKVSLRQFTSSAVLQQVKIYKLFFTCLVEIVSENVNLMYRKNYEGNKANESLILQFKI